ncbi:MAG: SUMF1/EgtB/PvdO family nonheme iron enzyme, partial [Planctomycetaceae bacterium]|nr:SUMF1/EgtB/PvdO family nonheme iron enzyme [Planctomycetaceae bacterium]
MNESDFLRAIEQDPIDPLPRLVYADWLDEQGDPRGELLRIQEELRQIKVPNRLLKESRMQELLKEGVEPLLITHTNSIGMQETLIFPGEFVMGSPSNEAGHSEDENQIQVQLTHPFWLGQCPVTRSGWRAIMGDRPWQWPNWAKDVRIPATSVSWEEVIAFCRELTEQELRNGRISDGWEYTLPTEAQWEYACRAGTTTPFFCGEDSSELIHHAWFDKTTWVIDEEYLHPVGQKQPNPWGLFDMHG